MIDWLLSVLRHIPEYFTQIVDVTLAGEGLQYLRLVPAPTTILTERDRYRLYLLWHGTSVFTVLSERELRLYTF